MGRRTGYPPGTFSWVDLATPDPAGARSFYGGLFGWTFGADAGGGPPYEIGRLDGAAVCGLAGTAERLTDASPRWTSYVTVDDAAAAAASARKLGGRVVGEAVDVGEAGRTASIEDPQGALLGLWQPGRRIGAERVNDVGCLCMNELATSDLAAARAFYDRLFGWTTEISADAPSGPHMVLNDGAVNAAVFVAPAGAPPHWRPCFTVASLEEAVRRARDLGGRQVGDPVELDHGGIAMLRDPQGALFTVFAGETDA